LALVLGNLATVIPASAAPAALSLEATPSPATPGAKVTLTAGVPVIGAGTVSQEIVQTIDPTKVKLTSLDDIVYPTGWTLSVSTDGTNFSSSMPMSTAAWSAVRAVKATGPVVSQGESNGNQIATGSSTQPMLPPAGAFEATSPGQDPWTMAFDDDGRIFTQVHHKYGFNGSPSIQCRTRSGSWCPNWTSSGYFVGSSTTESDFWSTFDAYMWVDTVNDRLWYPTWGAVGANASGWRGFGCVNVSPSAAPGPCTTTGLTNSYVSFGSFTNPNSGTYDNVQGLTDYRGRIFTFDVSTGRILCANISTPPLGQCAGGSWVSGASSVANFSNVYPSTAVVAYWGVSLRIIAGKLWVIAREAGASTARLACLDPISGEYCAGWSTSVGALTGNVDASTVVATGPVALPNATGQIVAVCGRGTGWSCFTASGTSYPVPTNFAANVAMSGQQNREPQTYGNRIYSSNGNGNIWCYDAASDAACSGFTRPGTRFGVFDHYTFAEDPLIPGCLWYATDAGKVGTINAATGMTCPSAPAQLVFGVETVVPRLGCTANSAISQWGTLTVTSPPSNTYGAATVDVLNNGLVVGTFPLTNGSVNLSGLSVSTSGTTPVFRVKLPDLTGSPASGSATMSVIGSSPQLCLTPTAVLSCPSGSGPVPVLSGSTTTVSATGSSTDQANVVSNLTPASTTVSIAAPSVAQCGGTLTGRAGTATLGTTGDALVGVTVTLLDNSGNVVVDGNNQPVTTTTDSNGNYSFGNLLPASYRVRFPGSGTTSQSVTAALSSVTTATGGSGTVTASCAASWTYVASTGNCVRTVTANATNVGPPVGSTMSYLVVGGGGGGAVYTANALTLGGAGGQVVTGSTVVNGSIDVTIGNGGGPGATGGATSISGSVTVSATGGAGGGGSNPASVGTSSTLSGATVVYGAGGANWAGTSGSGGLASGTANRGNGGGAGSRQYEGPGCYYLPHTFVDMGGPCGDNNAGRYENGGWSTINSAGSGGTGVVVMSYPATLMSNPATVPVGGGAVVNALYLSNPVARSNTSTGARGAVQTISPLADDTASTGASYSGGSTAVRLCGSGQAFPDCTATSVSITNQGTYAVSGTNVTFTPCSANNVPAGIGCTGAFTGVATQVSYQSTDSLGRTATSTITPTVVPLPTATADTSTNNWNTTQTISPLANDSAGSGATLSASSVKICVTGTADASCTGSSLTVANQGTYTVNANGTVSFVPLSTFTGQATAIKYVVKDSVNQTATATITPTVTAPPVPTAANETKTVLAGSSVTFTTLTGAGGLATSGGPAWDASASGKYLCGVSPVQNPPNCTQTSITIANEGTFSLNQSTGVVTYTTFANATTGAKTPIRYQVKDALGRTASAQLNPVIPGPPDAVNDTSTGSWDTVQSITVLANDTVSFGRTVDKSSVKLCTAATADASCSGTTLTIPGEGVYSVDANGVVSFDPEPTFTGAATPIKYVVADSAGQKDSATISPTVVAPPLPTATSQQKTLLPGETTTFTTLDRAGGLASSGGPSLLTSQTRLCGVSPAETAPNCTQTTVTTSAGTFSLDPTTGVVSYVANGGATSGAQPAVTYVVKDALNRTASSTLTPNIPPLPTSQPDSSRGEVNKVQSISPTGNDSPGQVSTPLDPATIKICAVVTPVQTPCTATDPVTIANKGTFTIDPTTKAVVFTPLVDVADFSEVAYTVTDSLGRSTTNKITVTVLPKPAPSAVSDTMSGAYGQAITFTPVTGSANASQADSMGTMPAPITNGNLTVTVSALAWGPMKLCAANEVVGSCNQTQVTTVDGTYVLDPVTNTVVFTPVSGFSGTATTPLQYQISNTFTRTTTDSNNPGNPTVEQRSETASAYLIPTVLPPAPLVANADTATTPWNTSVSANVAVNDTSGAPKQPSTVRLCGGGDIAPNCTQLTVQIANQGTYTVDPTTGTVTFTPLASFSGPATPVTYSIRDDLDRRASATFTPTVSAPVGPSALPDAKSVRRGDTVSFASILSGLGRVAAGNNSSGTNPVIDAATCLLAPGTNGCAPSDTVVTADGTYELDRISGVVRFTAAPNATPGPRAPINYRVTDSIGLTTTSALTPTIYAPPTVQNKAGADLVNTPQTFDALAGVTKDAAATVSASTLRLCGPSDVAPNCQQSQVIRAGVGTFTADASTGEVRFVPDPGFIGNVASVTYSVTDDLGQSASATITPSVVALPTPAAIDDSASGSVGDTLTFQPNSNDSPGLAGIASVQNLALDITSIKLCDVAPNAQNPPNCTATSVTTVDGTYTLDPTTGAVSFTGANGFVGAATNPLRYQISNTYSVGGVTSSATTSALLVPTINAANVPQPAPPQFFVPPPNLAPPTPIDPTPPPPSPDQFSIAKPDRPVDVVPSFDGVPATDPSFDQSTAKIQDPATGQWDTTVTTDQGTWSLNGSEITFVPKAGYTGLAKIEFQVKDRDGRVRRAVMSIWVVGDARLPVTGSNSAPLNDLALALTTLGVLAILTRRFARLRT